MGQMVLWYTAEEIYEVGPKMVYGGIFMKMIYSESLMKMGSIDGVNGDSKNLILSVIGKIPKQSPSLTKFLISFLNF